MAAEDLLQNIVDDPRETLDIELKNWIDPTTPSGIAKIAIACIAMRNNNGGYLVIGFENDGSPSRSPPPDVRTVYHVDTIQAIVSKYSFEAFGVSVEYRNRDGQEYPVVVIPTGFTSLACGKSTLTDAGRDLIEDHAVYVRSITSNNRVSSAKMRKSDIARVLKICFDNREADIGSFIRRHFVGVTQEDFSNLFTLFQQSTERFLITPDQLLETGRKRFFEIAKERNTALPKCGYMEAAMVVTVEGESPQPTQEFLDHLMMVRRDHSGWPPWTHIYNPSLPEMNPYVHDGAWEAFMAQGDTVFGGSIDYWSIHPAGRFYNIRALEDDLRHETAGVPPGQFFDFHLAIYRVTEVLSATITFANNMSVKAASNLRYSFRWTGLRGRLLESWSQPGRRLRRQARAYDNSALSHVEIPVDVSATAIPTYVHEILRSVFAVFDGYEIPRQVTEGIAAEVLERRMG